MKKLFSLFLALVLALSFATVAMAEEPVTITFETWNPGDDIYTAKIIEEFEAENPGIHVEYIYMPYSDHIADMQIKMANGEGPDIYGMQTGATYYEFREYEVDLTPYAEASWGEGWQSKFLDFCMGLLDQDGSYYGMPLGLTYAGFMWADVEKLESLGLAVPKSYDDLKTVTAALREAGEYPVAIGAKDDWINIDTYFNIANDINTEKFYDALEGKVPFTDEEMVKAFAIWQSCFTEGIFQDGCLGVNMYTDTTALWDHGDAPLHTNGSWTAGNYINMNDEDTVECFHHDGANHTALLVDWDNDGDPAGCQASIDVVLCMNANCEHKDEAWKFIDFLLHRGQEILINEALYYFPSRTDFVMNIADMPEDGAATLDYIVEQSKNNCAGYRELAYPELKQAICDALKALGTGEMTPEDAAAYVEEASQAQAR